MIYSCILAKKSSQGLQYWIGPEVHLLEQPLPERASTTVSPSIHHFGERCKTGLGRQVQAAHRLLPSPASPSTLLCEPLGLDSTPKREAASPRQSKTAETPMVTLRAPFTLPAAEPAASQPSGDKKDPLFVAVSLQPSQPHTGWMSSSLEHAAGKLAANKGEFSILMMLLLFFPLNFLMPALLKKTRFCLKTQHRTD